MTLFLILAAISMDCHPLDHDRILGSDLAAASDLFAALPPDLAIANAPRPGARRLVEPAELIRIARANNLEATGVVSLCFERATAPLDPEPVKAAMGRSLSAPSATIEVLALSKFPVPRGELVFPRDSLTPPLSGDAAVWNGYVAYDGGHFPLWAQVRLKVPQSRLVSVVNLAPGHVVEASDVRVEEATGFPRRVAPIGTIDAGVGLVARRALPAGTVLTSAMLEAPYDVERGQTVIVEVQSGGAVIKTEAKAQSSGRRGETVAVRNARSGFLFRAQIEGKGLVVVKCRSVSEVSQ
jgi:flagella basal body P-ring formation protein FlgA